MKILHLVHSFLPHSHGGTESYVAALASMQARGGHEVIVVTGTSCDQGVDRASRESPAGYEVFSLPPQNAWMPDGTDARIGQTLARMIGEERPDIVHVHHWHQLTTDAAEIAAGLGAPVVITLHDFFPTCPFFFRLRAENKPCPADLDRGTCVRCVQSAYPLDADTLHVLLLGREARFRREMEAASCILALSAKQQEVFMNIPWLQGVHIQVLPPPGPDLPRARVRRARPPDIDLRIVSWGGLVAGKGFHVVLEACERTRHPERIELHHFGRDLDPDHAGRLHHLRRQVRLELHGPFSPTHFSDVFPAYDLAAFPSFFAETYGLAVDEAMAIGLPVVVSDRGAPATRVGSRGIVVRAGDVESLAVALQQFIDKPEMLERLRRAQVPSLPTLTEHGLALETVYREALLPSHSQR